MEMYYNEKSTNHELSNRTDSIGLNFGSESALEKKKMRDTHWLLQHLAPGLE